MKPSIIDLIYKNCLIEIAFAVHKHKTDLAFLKCYRYVICFRNNNFEIFFKKSLVMFEEANISEFYVKFLNGVVLLIYLRISSLIDLFFFQYGFINYALELLVVKTFGEETWEIIK